MTDFNTAVGSVIGIPATTVRERSNDAREQLVCDLTRMFNLGIGSYGELCRVAAKDPLYSAPVTDDNGIKTFLKEPEETRAARLRASYLKEDLADSICVFVNQYVCRWCAGILSAINTVGGSKEDAVATAISSLFCTPSRGINSDKHKLDVILELSDHSPEKCIYTIAKSVKNSFIDTYRSEKLRNSRTVSYDNFIDDDDERPYRETFVSGDGDPLDMIISKDLCRMIIRVLAKNPIQLYLVLDKISDERVDAAGIVEDLNRITDPAQLEAELKSKLTCFLGTDIPENLLSDIEYDSLTLQTERITKNGNPRQKVSKELYAAVEKMRNSTVFANMNLNY